MILIVLECVVLTVLENCIYIINNGFNKSFNIIGSPEAYNVSGNTKAFNANVTPKAYNINGISKPHILQIPGTKVIMRLRLKIQFRLNS